MKPTYRKLEQAIGYRFRKKALLELALTHPSFRYEDRSTEDDNQRLEYLGRYRYVRHVCQCRRGQSGHQRLVRVGHQP